MHTVRGTELRALRRLQREQAPPSPYLFTTERRTPMSAAGFRKQLAVIGVAAELPFPIHPHMLRHGCGFALAHGRHDTRAIQEWLGHPQHPAHHQVHRAHHPPLQGLLAVGGLSSSWFVPKHGTGDRAKALLERRIS